MPFLLTGWGVRAQHRLLRGFSASWLPVAAAVVIATAPHGVSSQESPSAFDVDMCLDDLRTAAESDTGSNASAARTEYLAALYSLGRAEEAVRGWREWIEEDSAVLAAVNRLYWFCLSLMDTERTGEAAALLEHARVAGILDTERTYWAGMAKELLCAAYVEVAEFEHARDLALEIIRHGAVPEARILALYDLARAHEALGEGQEARAAWELLAATGGASPEATVASERLRRLSSTSSTSAAAATTLPGGHRCFHLGSWPTRAAAATQASEAKASGVEVVVREDASPRGTLFTVVGGAFSTDEKASEARARLVARGFTAIIEVDCPTLSEASP